MTEEAIFADALALADADRAAYLDRACGADTALRGEVEALLAAHAEDNPFDTPAVELAATSVRGWVAAASTPPPADTTLDGRYQLGDVLGEGGMGTVYRAEQFDPVRRTVAVKLIRPGLDSARVLARFQAERQALAVMDHPGIARVLDAGSLPGGRPYFVMEYVAGRPLTEYCDAHKLTLPARLALFVQVCQAVQHAHQKGVIHRDLKPGNVLVTDGDGGPACKVIDFGLAKALSAGVLPNVTSELGSAAAGTPLYMAPEQTDPGADIDTRADVYSLGVILYELLTGTTPIPDDAARRMSADELARAIRDTDPPPPAARVAETRGGEPARWARLLRGDLGWVTMKCLEKDRNRRYATANAVCLDVQRFLAHEPVLAGPVSRWYRAGKFVRRNRAGVVAAGVVVAALVAGLVGTTVGLRDAERQEGIARGEESKAKAATAAEQAATAAARAQVALLEKDYTLFTALFADLDASTVRADGEPLQAVLARRLADTAKHFDGNAVGDPLTVAGMRFRLGECLAGLGYPHEAIPLFEKCATAYNRHLGSTNPRTFDAQDRLAGALQRARRGGEAINLYADILARKTAAFGPIDPSTLRSRHSHAVCLLNVGRVPQAMPLLADTLDAMRTHLGPDDPATVDCMASAAACYRYAGKTDLALPLLIETLDRRRARLPADHLDVLNSQHHLAAVYENTNDPERARPLFEQAYLGRKAKLGQSHPRTLDSHECFARTLLTSGRPTPAIEEYAKLVAAYRTVPRPSEFKFAEVLVTVSSALALNGQVLAAESYLEEAHAIDRKLYPMAWREARTRSLLGWLRFQQGKQAEGESLLLAAFRDLTAREPKRDPGDALSRRHANNVEAHVVRWLVEVYRATDRPAEVAKWEAVLAKYREAGVN